MSAHKKPLPLPEPLSLRLKSLHIENYKAIDNLDIQFQGPKLSADPYVTVIGSENGIGKTSVLECCALLFLSLSGGDEFREWWHVLDFMRYEELALDPFQIMIRSGAKWAKIRGTFSLLDEEFTISLTCKQEHFSVEASSRPEQLASIFESKKRTAYRDEQVSSFLSLLGIVGEPMIVPPFLYFNSYRKIQEGNPELGMMMSGERHHWRRRFGPEYFPISAFKVEIVRALMGRQGLFESINEAEADAVVEQLNSLIVEYANGNLAKLRETKDRGVELRVNPTGSESSYPFDGLSSGQKEVISTLFLIWKYTRKQPGIVLIDEPELHLNAQWHRGFIRQLAKLQPNNQYIIATHSEHIFDSVDERNRMLLQSSRK